ncbi:hypothetical protein E0M25_12430 [Bacillus mycoides]|uniref:Uncharacterized protein n=1 Tax=Bacillus cereus TaxID=1396 RepID=A0A1S9ULA7_BACCE|nr:hypothetical protein BW892_17215 [Bacillus cereus]QWG45632.1 hypothetical protein EXW31_15710 [Bacillus mycoides]QWH12717.1 hypothetical protein EXW38_15730 [Bacillus mycoides]TBX77398.1 hypothetical protein E0M25_12430 [Bacillus mycoides]
MNLFYYKKDDGNLTKSVSQIILDPMNCYQSLNDAEFFCYEVFFLFSLRGMGCYSIAIKLRNTFFPKCSVTKCLRLYLVGITRFLYSCFLNVTLKRFNLIIGGHIDT